MKMKRKIYCSAMGLLKAFVLFFFLLFLAGSALAQFQPAVQVWVADAMSRAKRDDPPGKAGTLNISAARNEWEPFQIIVRAQGQSVRVNDVRVSDFTSPTDSIPASYVTFYRAQDIQVTTPSPDANSGPSLGQGWYPDILVPFKHLTTGAELIGTTYDAVPFTVKVGHNATFWADLFVPTGTPPGDYRTTVTVSFQDQAPQRLTVNLRVWEFDLPEVPTIRSHFYIPPAELEAYYKLPTQAASNMMYRRYADVLLDHKLMPGSQPETVPEVNPRNGDADFMAVVDGLGGTVLDAYRYYLNTRGMNALNLPLYEEWPWKNPTRPDVSKAVQNYLNQLYNLGKAHGWEERFYIYTFDEPPPGLPKVAQVARMIHAADPQLKNLVTLEESPNVEKLKLWFEDVDIVCLRNVTFDPAQAEKLKQMGKEIWIYVSGPSPPYPTLVLDYPAMAYRLLPWMCWKYGIKGLLYWCVNFWTKNPYQDTDNTPWGQNQSGVLYYPGPEGPVPSLRLAVFRDGIEDYEYLAMLRQLVTRVQASPAAMADAASRQLVTKAEQLLAIEPALVESMRLYSKDPALLERNRTAIAELIEKLQ